MSELKAGPELDAVIAEHVMGQEVLYQAIAIMPDGASLSVGRSMSLQECEYTCAEWSDGAWSLKPLPRGNPFYSTSVDAAMQVIEKMRQSQKWCCITIHSDHDYVWRVSFTRSPTEDSDTHEPAVSITGESLPECICLAALEAVESLEVKNETVAD